MTTVPGWDSLAKALLETQKQMPAVEKSETAEVVTPKGKFSYDYMSLDRLLKVTLPILNQNGIVLAQMPVDGGLETRLIHPESGETLAFVTPLVMSQETSQAHGSAISYARRYALGAVLGISSERDDDGAAASAEPVRKPKKQEVVTPAKPEKLRERLLELAAEADTIRGPAVEPETTWNELVRFAAAIRDTKLSDMDSVQLTLLGTELREYVDRHAKTGMTFFDYANTPF